MIRNRKIILLGRLFVWTVVAVNAGLISSSQQIEILKDTVNPFFSEKKLKSVLHKYKRSILVGLLALVGISLEIYSCRLNYWHRIKLEILRKFLDQVSLFVFMAFQDYRMHPQEEPVLAAFLDGALNEISIIFAVFRDEKPSKNHRNLILAYGYAVLKGNKYELPFKELSLLYQVTTSFLAIAPYYGKANLKTFYTIFFSWIDIDSLPVRGSILNSSPFVVRALCLKMLNKLHSERFRNRTHDSYSLASIIRGGEQIFCAVSDFFVIKISTIALLIIALKLSEVTPAAPQEIILGVSQEIVTVSLFPYLCQETNKEIVEETNKEIVKETNKEIVKETNKEIVKETNKEIVEETNKEIVEATSKQRPEGTGTSASVERKKRQRRNRRRVNTLFSVEQDLIEEEKALKTDKGNPPKTDLEEEDENSSNYFSRSYNQMVRERVRIKKD